MSNNRNLGNIATAITNATSGQVLTSQGSGVATFVDAGGTGVTVHNNQAAMLTDAVSADEGSLHYENLNNKLYVKQTSGFFLLASITNTAPTVSEFTETTGSGSATTIADNGTFTLTSGSNTVITLTATDPDLETLVYSATVTSGTASNVISSPSLPISNQSGNTFTLTPVTSGSGGTITIRFDVSDGNNVVNKTHSFSIAFTVVDSNYTTLLATATSTGANSTIEDSSTANSGSGHNITVSGDAHAGTFSPYRSGGYSTYFDGAGDRIHFVDSSLAEGTDDFTLECWFYLTANLQQNHTIFGHGATPGYQICAGNVNQIGFMKDGSNRLLQTGTLNLNQWYHIVYQRASGTLYGFLDGVSLGTSSNMTDDFTNTGIEVGVNRGGTEYFEGYIRDVRIVKGTTIYNTSETTFTPPTEALVAVSGSGYETTLLTCHQPYIADGGANSISPTIYNDVCIKPFSPYDYTEYSATDHGGSVYFDGNGDSLNTSTTQIIPSTSFTVTAWVYFNDTTDGALWGQGTAGHSGRTGITIDNNNWFAQIGSTQLGLSTSVSANKWYYTDLQWDGSTLKFFVNGSLIGSSNTSNSPTNSALYIGELGSAWSTGYPLNGYVSDLKVVSGSPSGSSSVPTAPLSSTGAELHIKGTDASIIDKSQNGHIKIINNTTGSSTNKGGNWANTYSIYFDGAQDGLVMPINQTIGTGDFTIEAFVKLVTYGSETNFGIFQSHTSSTVSYSSSYTNSVGFYLTAFDNNPRALCGAAYDGASTYGTGYAPLSYYENNWRHIAVAREGTNLRIYVEGNLVRTHTNSNSISATYLGVGALYNDTNSFKGNISDGRLTVGKARYTASDETANIPSAPLEG